MKQDKEAGREFRDDCERGKYVSITCLRNRINWTLKAFIVNKRTQTWKFERKIWRQFEGKIELINKWIYIIYIITTIIEIREFEEKHLKGKKLIEGRKPNYYIGIKVAQKTGQKAAYSKNKAFDKSYYLDLIEKAIREHKRLERNEIDVKGL